MSCDSVVSLEIDEQDLQMNEDHFDLLVDSDIPHVQLDLEVESARMFYGQKFEA